jgi:hypothetical protein
MFLHFTFQIIQVEGKKVQVRVQTAAVHQVIPDVLVNPRYFDLFKSKVRRCEKTMVAIHQGETGAGDNEKEERTL